MWVGGQGALVGLQQAGGGGGRVPLWACSRQREGSRQGVCVCVCGGCGRGPDRVDGETGRGWDRVEGETGRGWDRVEGGRQAGVEGVPVCPQQPGVGEEAGNGEVGVEAGRGEVGEEAGKGEVGVEVGKGEVGVEGEVFMPHHDAV